MCKIDQMNSEKIALFDFCDTIVSFQSADAYVRFVLQNSKKSVRKYILEISRRFLIRTRMMKICQSLTREGYVNKKILLAELKGMQYDTLDSLAKRFFDEVIIHKYRIEVISKIKELQLKGYKIYIISAGYDIYLKYVVDELKIDGLICTNLSFTENRFTGKYKRNDCLGPEKINRLKDFFHMDNLKSIDSIAFSDSVSDLPLFDYCRKGFVVCDIVPNWVRENNLEVLLWH